MFTVPNVFHNNISDAFNYKDIFDLIKQFALQLSYHLNYKFYESLAYALHFLIHLHSILALSVIKVITNLLK